MSVRIHQVSCSLLSGPADTDTFLEADRRCAALNRYAKRLGFAVMWDNVDEGESADEISEVLRTTLYGRSGEEGRG